MFSRPFLACVEKTIHVIILFPYSPIKPPTRQAMIEVQKINIVTYLQTPMILYSKLRCSSYMARVTTIGSANISNMIALISFSRPLRMTS